jgi:two-component system LytT family response regulator
MSGRLRVMIADDERPARSFLASILQGFEDVDLIGEATNGVEAIKMIKEDSPDLALLDLQMPEIDGLGVVRRLSPQQAPLIAFVTAYDEHAVDAFELNAIDYLLKPVARGRLRETLNRVQERLEQAEFQSDLGREITPRLLSPKLSSLERYPTFYLERIPIRKKEEILLIPVREIASIIAEGELLHLTTLQKVSYNISYRLKDLEARLDPQQFIRLGRGTLANLQALQRVSPLPGGTYLATLSNGQQLHISRLQGRQLHHLFRL